MAQLGYTRSYCLRGRAHGSRSAVPRFVRRMLHMIERKSVYCVIQSGGGEERCRGLGMEIQRSAAYCHVFERMWLVATSETAEDLYLRLLPEFGGDDQVLVLEVGDDNCNWLPNNPDVQRWLSRYL